jgi:5'-nucleotidase / UDP-sugar diphosphatase
MTGAQIREVLEQGLSLERGLIQVSGLAASYDLGNPVGRRLSSVTIGGKPLDPARVYQAATNSFLAQGGDLYQTFLRTKQNDSGRALSDVLIEHFRKRGEVSPPKSGRLRPAS